MTTEPPCPDCETDLLVERASGIDAAYVCHGCDSRFGRKRRRPVAYDDVDEWVKVNTRHEGRLHTLRSCAVDRADADDRSETRPIRVRTLSPSAAREHRYDRCLICGWELV